MKTFILYVLIGAALIILLSLLQNSRPTTDQALAPTRRIIDPASAPRSDTVYPRLPKAHVGGSGEIRPIEFSVGTIDRRFGIGRDRLLLLAREAKAVWEAEAGRELLRYDPGAALSVNLIYDERQERLTDARHMRSSITKSERSYEELREAYESERKIADRIESRHRQKVVRYNDKVKDLDARIKQWNLAGGAPAEIFTSLNAEQAALDREKDQLMLEDDDLQVVVGRVNRMVDELNDLVNREHMDVTWYNGHFVNSRPFDAGDYNGKEINIYAFDGEAELRATLVHEFGHALGLEHSGDSLAIMFPILAKQDLSPVRLGLGDKELIRKKLRPPAISQR